MGAGKFSLFESAGTSSIVLIRGKEVLNLTNLILLQAVSKNFLIFIAFCATTLLFSCYDHLKTDANNDQQGYSNAQVIGVWKITAVNSDVPNDWNGDGLPETDIYATWSACQKDNLYSFIVDYTGTFKLNCTITETGSWQVVNTQHLQFFSPTTGIELEKFIAMSNLEFKTTRGYTLSNGQPATVTKTWTRQ